MLISTKNVGFFALILVFITVFAGFSSATATRYPGTDLFTGGTATADSVYQAGYEAHNSFDDVVSSASGDRWLSALTYPHWIYYDFGVGNCEVGNTINFISIISQEPEAIVFAGSSDASSWTQLGTATAEDNNIISEVWQSFNFTNSDCYRYYRIYFTSASFGGTTRTSLQEAELIYRAPASVNFRVYLNDYWNNETISTGWAYLDGTNFTTTNGTIETTIQDTSTSLYNITVGANNHFTRSYEDVNVSGHLYAQLYGSDIKFRAYEEVTDQEVTANFTINSTTLGANQSFYLYSGNHNVTINKTDYIGQIYPFNVSAEDNRTINVTVYDAVFNVIPRDVINNNTITNANITISNSTYSYTTTINGVSEYSFNLTSGEYFLSIEAPDRVTYEENVTVSAGNENHYSYMYAYNSLWVYAFKQADATSIINFNVSITNLNNSYSVNGSSGVARINDIVSGVYDVVISAVGYASASYSITVTDNSHQTLNAYLTGATDTFIFNVINWNTYNIIEGATITQKRYVNDTLTTVSSGTSNIIGQIQFSYETGIEYTFTASADDYETRTFTLEILQDEYSIRLLPLSSVNTSVYFDDVNIEILNASFTQGTSYVIIDIFSNGGSLEDYSLIINSSYNNTAVSGTNSVGSRLTASISTPLVTYGETAIVTIKYKSSLNAGYKTRTIIYSFEDWTPDEGSLLSIREDLEDLTEFEKVFYATIIILMFAGFLGLGGVAVGDSLTFSAIGGVFGLAICGIIGLLAWKVATIPIFLLLMIIIFKLKGD